MDRVVFGVAMPAEMAKALDKIVLDRRRAPAAPTVSRSGIIREMIAAHLAASASATVSPRKKR